MPVTTRPAAMTTIRLGSQVPLGMPNTSRKPKTLVVCTMREITRPAPKMKPQRRLASAGMALASDNVMRHRDDDDRRDHEYDRRRDRARRQPRNTADAVAGGAAVAEPGAEADQEAGDRDRDHAARHLRHRHRVAEQRRANGRRDQAGDEGQPPEPIVGARIEQPAGNAADAGNAAGEQHQQHGGKPDQRAADGRREGSEIGHGFSLAFLAWLWSKL